MSIMNDANDGVDQSMDVGLFNEYFPNGLQQNTAADISLLDGIDFSDLLTSPSPNYGFTNFDAMNAMEANSAEAAAIQVNSENYGGFPQNLAIRSPFSDSTFSAVSPMTPQAHAVPVVPDGGLIQSDRIDSSLAEIEPMRVDSEDVREALMADPNALGESLGSIELNATRSGSMQSNDHSQGPSASRLATQRQALPDSSQTQTTTTAVTSANGTTAKSGGYFSDYQLPELQSNDHSQGPSASRLATQRQALPDSSQTQTTAVTSANGTTAKSGGYFSDYQLPEFHHFKVSVKFLSTPMLEKVVTKKGGCLLHYQPSDQPPIPVQAEEDRISISVKIKHEPDGPLKEFPWVKEKQKRFTELILKGFHRGIEFHSREGNIYATRRSNTKLFWHNTDEQPGIAKELSRNEETEVFNWKKFQQTMAASVALGNRSKLRLPAIWFSFAQKWDMETSLITTKLVWARVDPTRACEMVKNINPDVRSTESLESLHTSLFGISNDASLSV